MLAEEDRPFVAVQLTGDLVAHPQLVGEPERQRHQVGTPPLRRVGDVGLEQPFEFHERLLVEADEIDLVDGDSGFLKAVRDGVRRERRVVLLPGEALFLGRRDDAAILDQARGRVVVIGGDSEDPGGHECSVG
jgi:hypothetical protein